MNVDWDRFCEVIKQSNNVVLTSHIRPDCDALGSCLGMAGILRKLGKQVRIVCGQPVPPNLQFIDPNDEILAINCLLYTSPSPRDLSTSRMPSSA